MEHARTCNPPAQHLIRVDQAQRVLLRSPPGGHRSCIPAARPQSLPPAAPDIIYHNPRSRRLNPPHPRSPAEHAAMKATAPPRPTAPELFVFGLGYTTVGLCSQAAKRGWCEPRSLARCIAAVHRCCGYRITWPLIHITAGRWQAPRAAWTGRMCCCAKATASTATTRPAATTSGGAKARALAIAGPRAAAARAAGWPTRPLVTSCLLSWLPPALQGRWPGIAALGNARGHQHPSDGAQHVRPCECSAACRRGLRC